MARREPLFMEAWAGLGPVQVSLPALQELLSPERQLLPSIRESHRVLERHAANVAKLLCWSWQSRPRAGARRVHGSLEVRRERYEQVDLLAPVVVQIVEMMQVLRRDLNGELRRHINCRSVPDSIAVGAVVAKDVERAQPSVERVSAVASQAQFARDLLPIASVHQRVQPDQTTKVHKPRPYPDRDLTAIVQHVVLDVLLVLRIASELLVSRDPSCVRRDAVPVRDHACRGIEVLELQVTVSRPLAERVTHLCCETDLKFLESLQNHRAELSIEVVEMKCVLNARAGPEGLCARSLGGDVCL